MDPFADWYVHQVVVRKLDAAATSDAQSFQGPVTLDAWVEQTVQVVRDSSGSEVTSTASVFLPASAAGKVTAGSQVTAAGRVMTAIAVSEMTIGSPLDGVTVMCG